jgi:pyruvate kinase
LVSNDEIEQPDLDLTNKIPYTFGALMNRRAKIVATIGPVSIGVECLKHLAEAGMDVARLNFSHGDHEFHAETIRQLRQVSEETGKAIAILQDLSGPKLRTGKLENDEPVRLEAGNKLTLTTHPVIGTKDRIFVDYAALPADVKPGDHILLDDGSIELSVLKTTENEVQTEIVNGGILGNHKGINLPGVVLSAPALSKQDLDDLAFGIDQGVDAVALSFVRRAEDIHTLRGAIAACCSERQDLPIIAKLERPEAVARLDPILEATDGVMVARGDLGVEVAPERVPSIQKEIIQRANEEHRIVITATQMLESMMENPHPTRAEASDVANAVFDGSDALMLSGETAVGKYPIKAVETMARIILDAEAHMSKWGQDFYNSTLETDDDAVATTHAARMLAHDRDVAAIAVFTRSGRTAKLMSSVRPRVPIWAFTPDSTTYQRMALLWGVQPFLMPMANSVEEMIEHVRTSSLASGLTKPGDQVVLVASFPIGAMGIPNFTLLHRVE